MQYKDLLLAFCAFFSCSAVHAQKRMTVVQEVSATAVPDAYPRSVAAKKDTAATPLSTTPKIAEATICRTSVTAPTLTVPATSHAKYKDVPLAGQQAYFGGMNDYVMNFVRQYFSVNNKTLSIVQARGKQNFSMIDNILQKHDIPVQLKYLAVIESALNVKAVSRVGAVGPWQFMETTARLMGLTVSGKRDERTDLYKSTTAAAKYLSYLYEQLNDWLLVVAAYNSGPAPVKRAIAKTGSTNFWEIKQYLPRETQGHVLAFIATATIFESLSSFIGNAGSIPAGFHFGDKEEAGNAADVKEKHPPRPSFTREELEAMVIIRVTQPMSLELMAHELNIDRKLLNKWNPDYELFIMDVYPENHYDLRIPKEKLNNFVARKEFLEKRSRQIFEEMSI